MSSGGPGGVVTSMKSCSMEIYSIRDRGIDVHWYYSDMCFSPFFMPPVKFLRIERVISLWNRSTDRKYHQVGLIYSSFWRGRIGWKFNLVRLCSNECIIIIIFFLEWSVIEKRRRLLLNSQQLWRQQCTIVIHRDSKLEKLKWVWYTLPNGVSNISKVSNQRSPCHIWTKRKHIAFLSIRDHERCIFQEFRPSVFCRKIEKANGNGHHPWFSNKSWIGIFFFLSV